MTARQTFIVVLVAILAIVGIVILSNEQEANGQTPVTQDWTPDLLGTGAKPSLGTGSTRIGSYTHDGQDWCRGFGLIRWGTGGNDGLGYYRLTLPEPADPAVYDQDPSNAEIIGVVTIGAGLEHWTGNIHLNGLTGYTSLTNGVVAIEDALFLSDAQPNATLANIHYHLDYACEPIAP